MRAETGALALQQEPFTCINLLFFACGLKRLNELSGEKRQRPRGATTTSVCRAFSRRDVAHPHGTNMLCFRNILLTIGDGRLQCKSPGSKAVPAAGGAAATSVRQGEPGTAAQLPAWILVKMIKKDH